jgi:hypothetical protein
MSQATALAFPEENLVGWERALYAFLVEKERRSGSSRTVQGYSSMLQDFFGRMPKPPVKVSAQEDFVWTHQRRKDGPTRAATARAGGAESRIVGLGTRP